MNNRSLLIQLLMAVILLVAAISVASAQHLVVNAGTYLKNDANITLYNTNIQNNGVISSSVGCFMFSGSAANTISGGGVTNVHDILMNKQNGAQLQLQKNMSASGTILFNGGIFDLGDHQLELIYPGGMLQNESSSTRMLATGSGEVFISQVLNAPTAINPGNLGAIITSSKNLNTTIIKRGHSTQAIGSNGQSIARYFTISPVNNTSLNATLRFSYLDAELNNNPESSLVIWQKTTGWAAIGSNSADANANYVEKTGISSFNSFTLGKSLGALPLQLTSFNLSCKNGNAYAQWTTANEVNTKQFVIEASIDGVNWKTATTIAAQGNALQHSYEATITAGVGTYFRLKMEDTDGKFTYSVTKRIDCDARESVVVGPNPTRGKFIISATVNTSDVASIVVYDVSGKIILSRPWILQKGSNSQSIDISAMANGTYIVKVQGTDLKYSVAMVKQ